MKGNWYAINAECVKEDAGVTARLGEKDTVAKVKSLGLAYVTAMGISEAMGECFAITIDKINEKEGG